MILNGNTKCKASFFFDLANKGAGFEIDPELLTLGLASAENLRMILCSRDQQKVDIAAKKVKDDFPGTARF